MINADSSVDELYERMRSAHGAKNAYANGYRLHRFFKREQRLLLSHLEPGKGPILDIACGSGLMLLPLAAQGTVIIGVDFNETACMDARRNGLTILRGDAFNLPIAGDSIAQAVNCQFLNQQPKERTQRFIEEAARVLMPGGRLLILWRHADSLLHRSAHAALQTLDKFTGAQPEFPQYTNTLDEIATYAPAAGLSLELDAVTLPALWPDTLPSASLRARIFGASLFAILKK
jgi:ubiquinone/menaquinone biosynthesis C-methylase UbiE